MLNRLKEYIDFKHINISSFEKSIGMSNASFGKSLKNGGAIGSDKLEIILKVYPDINTEWLLLGTGEMIKDNSISLETSFHEPNSIYQNKVVKIPIMDISVAAGITGFINSTNFDSLDQIILPSNMLRKSYHVCVKTKGESMTPTILDSDNVVIRLLDKSEWSDMPDEHVYVVVDKEGKGYIKRIKNRLHKGFIVCMSDNIDKFNYPNFNLDYDEIISIWHAEWHISAKFPNINANYYSRVKQLEDSVDEIIERFKTLKPV